MPENLMPINVWLSGRSYRIRVKPEEEGLVRKAVKMADDQIMEMRRHYAGKDDQDFVAMCLLAYAANNTIEAAKDPLLHAELQKMADKVDKALGQEGLVKGNK